MNGLFARIDPAVHERVKAVAKEARLSIAATVEAMLAKGCDMAHTHTTLVDEAAVRVAPKKGRRA